jgi:hypothetical protein
MDAGVLGAQAGVVQGGATRWDEDADVRGL